MRVNFRRANAPAALTEVAIASIAAALDWRPAPVFVCSEGCPMKVANSLKALMGRHRANKLVRRRGRVYIINKVDKRFKARQG